MKREKRQRYIRTSTTTGLDIYKQTWCCLLATQEVQIPLGTFWGFPCKLGPVM